MNCLSTRLATRLATIPAAMLALTLAGAPGEASAQQAAPEPAPAALPAPALALPAPAPGQWAAAPAPAAPALRLLQGGRTLRWEGAAIGFVTGAVITYAVLNTGQSTARCNRDANQDAMAARYCAAAYAAGGVVLAPVGYLVGSRIRVGQRR
jgi:hypothetical protein